MVVGETGINRFRRYFLNWVLGNNLFLEMQIVRVSTVMFTTLPGLTMGTPAKIWYH
jgi:hypothetical protein